MESKTITFTHGHLGNISIVIMSEEKEILFFDDELRNKLNIQTKKMISSDNYSGMVEVSDLFEYFRFSKLSLYDRVEYENWIKDIILDCAKLI